MPAKGVLDFTFLIFFPIPLSTWSLLTLNCSIELQSFHMMWFADTSAWEHKDVTARPRMLMKTTLIYPCNMSLCSPTLTSLVQLSEPETQTGKAHPRSILIFTLRWFNLFPCSSCWYCARNSSLEESERVAQGKTSTYLNMKHLPFTLFYCKEIEFFPF